jgi:hypothetical protein
MFIMRFGASSCLQPIGSRGGYPVDSWALTDAERALLTALEQRGVRYMVVGLSAALLEGATVATQDIDLWFHQADPEVLRVAAGEAGGFFTSGFGMQPPGFGGVGLERVDYVFAPQGLDEFEIEYSRAIDYDVEGVRLKVLPLERVLASKRAANRPKDQAQIPALEAALAARAHSKR